MTQSRPGNLAAALVSRAATDPDLRLGVIGDDVRLADALGIAAGRARRLLDSGIAPGDRIALVAPTTTDYLLTWLACLLAGTPVALVNPTYPDDLTRDMLAPLAPARVIDADEIAQVRSAATASTEGLPGLQAGALDTASFMHTSGTTGLPKFCAQSHEYFLRLGDVMAEALEVGPGDRVLAPLPMFHINPLGYGIVTALLAGADAFTVERFSASGFWPAVVGEQITVLVLHAPPAEILKRATTSADAAGHRVKSMFFADGEFLDTFGIDRAVTAYGSTEAGGVSHLRRWRRGETIPPDASRHGGQQRADVQWRLGADDVIHVREREPGTLFSGYVTADGLASSRDAEGWFDTGDLGRIDADGGLVFLERRSESIRVKGEFVPIPFVENHLFGVDGVDDCAIWKRRGELVDEEVVAYVVAPPLAADALRDHLVDLPAFMRPVAVARVETLPRDAAAGKVQRRRLAETSVLEWIEL